MLPESRKEQGLVMGRPVIENVTLASLSELAAGGGFVSAGRERRAARSVLTDVGVPPDRMRVPVSQLSGGNQQKTLFAKWLLRRPRAFIADEPTRGVDIGAKRAIYELLAGLAAEGMAVILISSDLDEVLGLAHRVLVMREGRLVAEFDAKDVTEERVMTAAFGAQTTKEVAARAHGWSPSPPVPGAVGGSTWPACGTAGSSSPVARCSSRWRCPRTSSSRAGTC
jgi:ABC-type sugar transport system ATPase subunit